MSLEKSQRGILPTLRFVRMTLIAVQFVFLENCYIISLFFHTKHTKSTKGLHRYARNGAVHYLSLSRSVFFVSHKIKPTCMLWPFYRNRRRGVSGWRPTFACQHLAFRVICSNFAASEGRNPWTKNAFLALFRVMKSPTFKGGMKMRVRSFCLLRICKRVYSSGCTHFYDICDSVRYLFLLFISLMVFGDTNNTMSTTSPYAFLVAVS